ncbi:MAG: hypothetical protein AAB597_01990 [Patescibacteria group bacterium]
MKRRRKISQRKKLKGKTSNEQGVRVTGQMALAAAGASGNRGVELSEEEFDALARAPEIIP